MSNATETEAGKPRPDHVEVGQRWTNGRGDFATVVRFEGARAILKWDTGDETDPMPHDILTLLKYLGLGGPPIEQGRPRVMAANAGGYPALCFICGEDKGHMNYTCGKHDKLDWTLLCDEWHAGARDFPRPHPTTEPVPGPTPHTCKHGAVGLCQRCQLELQPRITVPAASPQPTVPAHDKRIAEIRRAMSEPQFKAPYGGEGHCRTALEAIQARKKPEPWIPTCDDDHWIPDAGTSWRNR